MGIGRVVDLYDMDWSKREVSGGFMDGLREASSLGRREWDFKSILSKIEEWVDLCLLRRQIEKRFLWSKIHNGSR